MKITTITIENFKSLKRVELEKLSNINMIYGHNNSGKSNILKFIELLFSRKLPENPEMRVDRSRSTRFDFEQPSFERSSNFWEGIIENAPYIYHKNNDVAIKFDVTIEFIERELEDVSNITDLYEIYPLRDGKLLLRLVGEITSLGKYNSTIKLLTTYLNDSIIFNASTGEYFQDIEPEHVVKTNSYLIHNSILEKLNDSVVFLDNDRYFLEEIEVKGDEELTPKTFKNWFHNLSLNPDRRREFSSILEQVAKFRPSGDAAFQNNEKNSPIHQHLAFQFGRIHNDIEVFLTTGNNGTFPLSSFGTGIQQILYILSKIAEKKPKIILLEEIELNLSPRYQYELVQHIMLNLITEDPGKRTMFQLFFTTHSPLLCVNTQFIVYKTTIDENGESSAIKIGEQERKSIKDFYPKDVIDAIIEQQV